MLIVSGVPSGLLRLRRMLVGLGDISEGVSPVNALCMFINLFMPE